MHRAGRREAELETALELVAGTGDYCDQTSTRLPSDPLWSTINAGPYRSRSSTLNLRSSRSSLLPFRSMVVSPIFIRSTQNGSRKRTTRPVRRIEGEQMELFGGSSSGQGWGGRCSLARTRRG